MGSKEKIKLTFLRLFDNPLSKYLIFKRISCMQWLFWVITKIKQGSGTSFWCTFSAWCFHKKCSLLNTLSLDKVSMLYLFSFSRYQAKCVISSYLSSRWGVNFKIYLRTTIKAMADGEKKRGRRKYKNLNIWRTKGAFYVEIKNIFHSFWRAIIW